MGKVKTRIAAQTSDQRALEIYRELLSHTHTVTQAVYVHRILYYSSYIDKNDQWKPISFDKKLQHGDHLGAKMYAAIKEELSHHQKVVLVGSDIGALTTEIINQAFDALEHNDVVIGPAFDGGYYLIGMTIDENIFEDIDWSTDKVLVQTISAIKSYNLSYSLLEPLSDIDFIEDYRKWKGDPT